MNDTKLPTGTRRYAPLGDAISATDAATEAEPLFDPAPASSCTLSGIIVQLASPFPVEVIEIKPGATTQDKSRALALAYADMRVYFERLDAVAGVEAWQSDYQMTARGVLCRLTICGVTKSGIGDYPLDAGDANPATSAEAQAFKRACAAFGIGRYLYGLAGVWVAYDAQKRQITDPAGAARELYRRAGLLQPAAPVRTSR
jgi:hypothetical protein